MHISVVFAEFVRNLQEPEVVDLANFLNSCGACIRGAGTNTLAIRGVKSLDSTDFTIIPDRIEAGTFLVAAAMTRSLISMSPVIPHHLRSVISKLEAVGCVVQETSSGGLQVGSCTLISDFSFILIHYLQNLQISAKKRLLKARNFTTLPYPGIPTDVQPQLMVLMTMCEGSSIIQETVFESRMRHGTSPFLSLYSTRTKPVPLTVCVKLFS